MGPSRTRRGAGRRGQAGTQRASWLSVSAGPAVAGVRKELVGALGGAVTFPVTHSVNQVESIVWTFNTTPLVTIQPEMADRQDNVIVIQAHNKERVSFPQGNYSLKLSKLTKGDTGTYRVTLYSPLPSGPFSQEFGLRVYGEWTQSHRWWLHGHAKAGCTRGKEVQRVAAGRSGCGCPGALSRQRARSVPPTCTALKGTGHTTPRSNLSSSRPQAETCRCGGARSPQQRAPGGEGWRIPHATTLNTNCG